jgi:phage anti-repressor protein
MSFFSPVQQQEHKDAESLDSRDKSQPKCDCKQLSDSKSSDRPATSQFGHDFSGVKLHADEGAQALPSLRTQPMVQRFPKGEDEASAPCPTCPEAESADVPAAEPETAESEPTAEAEPAAAPGSEPETEPATPGETPASGLIVEDSAAEVGPGQMRKSGFLRQLRAEVCRTIETAIAGSGRSTDGCPYIGRWFDFYERQDSAHLVRAIHRYAPEASSATTAGEYISAITQRARQSAETWARTGEITGVPEGIPMGMPGMGLLGGLGSLISGIGSIFFKARKGGARKGGDPRAVQKQLGNGQPLDSGVRSRMESAFGMDFSHVRTHTDKNAAGLSNDFNARAFTVGEHIAFGAGEYQPGTLTGDALIAHEMAHVVQQSGSDASVAPKQGGETTYNSLEDDADKSALGVVVSLWGGIKEGVKKITGNAVPGLRSGLQISRCKKDKKKGLNDKEKKMFEIARGSERVVKLEKEAKELGFSYGGQVSGEHSYTDPTEKKIYIEKELSAKKAALAYAYELQNAINVKTKYNKIFEKAEKGEFKNASEYAIAILNVEVEALITEAEVGIDLGIKSWKEVADLVKKHKKGEISEKKLKEKVFKLAENGVIDGMNAKKYYEKQYKDNYGK